MPNISIDEYLSKRALSVNDGIVYRAAKMPKSFDGQTRSAVFVMTDETTDSYGDTVRAKGADLTRFESNPICLLNHRSDLILGNWSDVQKKPKRIEGRATLAAEGTAPHIDMAYGLLEQGILRAASIGFMPTKLERKLDDKGEPTWAYDILEWEMYECSIVAVPSNPAALAKSIKEGNMLARDFLEEVLDTYTKTAAGLIVPRAELETAHKEATGSKTSILTTTIELDAKSLDRLEAIAERMEKAALASEWSNGDMSREDAMKALGFTVEPEVDPAAKELSETFERSLIDILPKVDAIDEPERKSGLKKLLENVRDGIQSMFKTAEPGAEPVSAPPPADPEVQKALKERLAKIAAPEAA